MTHSVFRIWSTLLGVLIVAGAAPARAQQAVVFDQTYTATSANTMDSHYRVSPAAEPANWSAPVNYSGGKIHVHFEVLSKPSNAITLLNVCFEGSPSYACMPYSDPYTATGAYDYEYAFSGFYQANMVDWSMGVDKIALILKDQNEVKKQGDPAFYPTQMHVTITLVAQGATYVPPAAIEDAGIDAATSDAGTDAAMLDDASTPAPDAATVAPIVDAGTTAPPNTGSGGSAVPIMQPPMRDAGTSPPASAGSGGAMPVIAPPVLSAGPDDGSCSVQRMRGAADLGAAAWPLGIALCSIHRRRRRRR